MMMYDLIDPKKKAKILARIKDGKEPFCAAKPAPDPARKAPVVVKKLNISLSEEEKKLRHAELLKAIRHGSRDDAKRALDAGADPDATDTDKTSSQRSVLAEACAHERFSIVKLLLEYGASDSIYTVDSAKQTPLHIVAGIGNLDIVRLLLDYFQAYNPAGISDYLEAETGGTTTALMIAATHHYVEIVKLLLERGADVNHATCKFGRCTALDYAIGLDQNWVPLNEKHREEVIRILKENYGGRRGHEL